MSRWKPDARRRLEQAASELFRDKGYDATTVADIAARAGLSERTFFRHYADKREVLFGGGPLLEATMVAALESAPAEASTFAVLRLAVEAIAELFRGRRALALERQELVNAHDALRERGLIKRASLTAALVRALRRRGVPEAEAGLAADVGMSIFHVGFDNWVRDDRERDFTEVIGEEFGRLSAVLSEGAASEYKVTAT